jgi:acyl-homoserine-lactone acylase
MRGAGRLMVATVWMVGACSGRPAPPAPEPAVSVDTAAAATTEATAPAGTVCEPGLMTAADPRAELLWDSWGVPHIFAEDMAAGLYAFGWAQAHSHGDLILRLYGQARGRAAEYWGPEYLDSDRWVVTNGVPARAEQWLAQTSAHVRSYVEAFANGINVYARENAACIADEVEVVLPVTAADVLAHVQRVIHFTFLTDPGSVPGWTEAADGSADGDSESAQALDAIMQRSGSRPGSNAWAVAPQRSASGHALLLANPHLPWGDLFTWYEAQLVGPDVDAYGASLVGFPLPGIAFNDRLGWTHTVNTLDGADLYELRLLGDGYALDGGVRAFEVEQRTLRVRQPDGTFIDQPLEIRRSVHGPIVGERNGNPIALRVAGLDQPHLVEQTWDMLRAADIGAFESALSRQQIPLFTVMYADADGHILHVFNGSVPVRPYGGWSDWAGIVRGDTSATLWTSTHFYGQLPRALDPQSGWLQNANDPPWTTTFPSPLDAAFYPDYMAPRGGFGFRPQRSARLLAEDEQISFDELVAYKHDTRAEAADHVLEDVIHAARLFGDDRARAAADVLEAWDRTMNANSRGAILFEAFMRGLARRPWPTGSPYDVEWTSRAPLATPDGLSDPAGAATVLSEAAAQVEERHGAIDVAWGDVYRLRRDGVDLPANGGPGQLGVFRVTQFAPDDDGRYRAVFGDSWIAAVEFSQPLRARALLAYGNASQPGSPHRTDQLPLYARKELRPVWRTRAEVEANTVRTDRF